MKPMDLISLLDSGMVEELKMYYNGRKKRIEDRLLDVLPLMQGSVSVGSDIIGIEGPDLELLDFGIKSIGFIGRPVELRGIIREEPCERLFLKLYLPDTVPLIQARPVVIVSPAHIEPDVEPHNHNGRPA